MSTTTQIATLAARALDGQQKEQGRTQDVLDLFTLLLNGAVKVNDSLTTGTALNINKLSNTGPTIKAHCHLLAHAADNVANEFKGESLNTSSTCDGIAAHFHMSASGTSVLRSVLGVAYLDTGITLSGTSATGSWLVGGLFSATVAGVVNGTAANIVGLYGGIASCAGGTLTACQYVTSIWADSQRVVGITAGSSSLILATSYAGCQPLDYGIHIETGTTIVTGIGITNTCTTGISLAGATTTGIHLSSTATKGIYISGAVTQGILIGTAASPLTTTVSSPQFGAYITSAATTGNVQNTMISTVLTGAGGEAATTEALTSLVTCAVHNGNWINAIFGKVDFSTAGYVQGSAAAISAEIDLNSTNVGDSGAYYCFAAELNVAGTFLGSGNKTAFMVMNAWGTQVATWQANGYIFDLNGLSAAGAGEVFDTCTAAAASHSLRILIDGVPYYILLQSNVDA